jgi:hypothetical protein
MRVAFGERWRVYLVWLGSGMSGISPDELRLTLGPVRRFVPLARQVAGALGPWLGALLLARQRHGMPALDLRQRALAGASAGGRNGGAAHPWLGQSVPPKLAEIAARGGTAAAGAGLAEAPEDALWRSGWLAWEVRYWALAVCLARIGQLYTALEQRQKPAQAQRLFRARWRGPGIRRCTPSRPPERELCP